MTLDFKPGGQSGHFWLSEEVKIIFERLLSHGNQEKIKTNLEIR